MFLPQVRDGVCITRADLASPPQSRGSLIRFGPHPGKRVAPAMKETDGIAPRCLSSNGALYFPKARIVPATGAQPDDKAAHEAPMSPAIRQG